MPEKLPLGNSASLCTVGEYSSLDEALLVRALLNSYGIEATLADENFMRMYGGSIHSHKGIPIQVAEIDAEAALEILHESKKSTKELQDGTEVQDIES